MSEPNKNPGLWVHGASGRMGREIFEACNDDPEATFRLIGGSGRHFASWSTGAAAVDRNEVTADTLAKALGNPELSLIVDFSSVEGHTQLFQALSVQPSCPHKSLLIGTTGLSQDMTRSWADLVAKRDLSLLFAPNTSLGILFAIKTALLAVGPLSKLGFDIEVVETHHRHKKDAPSGTARLIAEALTADASHLQTITERAGQRQAGELAIHSVRGGGVFGEHSIRILGEDEELCISHRAFSRSLFAKGALQLGAWLIKQQPGIYQLLDIDLADLNN